MSPPRNVRSNSHGRRLLPAHAKPTKPSAIKVNKNPSPAQKSGSGWSKSVGKKDQKIEDSDDQEIMALPDFCAYCEKQIVTPSDSILYCSERCRKKDGSKPVSTASLESPEPSPLAFNRSFSVVSESQDYPDILPHRSPTSRPASFMALPYESSFFDIDPVASRRDSEANRYLTQFQSSSVSPERQRRPQFTRAHTSSNPPMPSLSHTPGSVASPSSSYSSIRHLPCRTNPYGPPMASRSTDLVVPINVPSSINRDHTSLRSSAGTSTAYPVAEGELSYEKKMIASASPSTGSLQQLFSHDAMRRDPVRPSRRR